MLGTPATLRFKRGHKRLSSLVQSRFRELHPYLSRKILYSNPTVQRLRFTITMAASNTPENVRQKIEQELHSELLPGTELMTEVAGVHLVHAHNAPNAVALVPQPSFDPSDPLVGFPV